MIFMDNKENEQKDSAIEKGKQNIINSAAKTGATALGGPVGGEIYDKLSQTELGKKVISEYSKDMGKNVMPGNHMPGMPAGLPNPGLQDKTDENNGKNKESSKNNKSSNVGDVEDETDVEGKSEGIGIIQKWKSLPQPVKSIIMVVVPCILSFIVIMLIVAAISVMTASISENLYEKMTSAGETISDFFDDASNFFVNNEGTREEKAERAYYEKLQDVYEEFKEKYNVAIDTTMITATLFYGRTVDDYGREEETDKIEGSNTGDKITDDNWFYESDETEDNVKFYKLAKRHIKTLAKYMLIQNTTFGACVPDDQKDYVTLPITNKEVADNWTTISTWKFNDHSSWNSRNTFNYEGFEEKTYTNANGEEKTITWCKFNEADEQLRKAYEEDRKIYKEKELAYNVCVNSQKDACIRSCDPTYTKECIGACNDKDEEYKANCTAEKAAADEAYKYYYNNWLAQGLYDDSGNFYCKSTEKWGHLEPYDDASRYMNHNFDIDLKNKGALPNFLEHYAHYIYKEQNDCTADPPISYVYSTDISEEGVYYYKLLTETTAGFFSSKKSFIERYYPELIDNSSEEMRYKSAKKVVDEIFLLYDTVVDRTDKYCVTPGDVGNVPVSSSRQEFINSIADEVIKDMENSGILASVTIAQAILESAGGTSSLNKGYNNYYGFTAGDCAPPRLNTTTPKVVKAGTGENRCTGNAYWNGDVVWHCNRGTDCQWYRIYDSFSNSTHDHSRLLSTPRYNCQGIGNPVEQLQCIKDGGYAEDEQYVSKLINVINSYNLTQYDIGEWNGEILGDMGSSGLGTICYDNHAEKEIANGEGTINGVINGQRTQLYGTPEYTTFWLSNNNLFYASNPNLVEQCTWYAHGRGLEILTSNGMDLVTAKRYMNPMHGNAGLWYGQNKYFSSSTSVNNPKVGAIVVWKNPGKPGHVAVIEDVQYDSNGNAVSVSLSEGGKSINGFRYTKTRSIDYIRKHGTYNFVGYVYLLG